MVSGRQLDRAHRSMPSHALYTAAIKSTLEHHAVNQHGQRRTSSTCRSGHVTFLPPLYDIVFYRPIPYWCVVVSGVVEKTSTRRRSQIPCVVVEKNTTLLREGVGVVVEKNEESRRTFNKNSCDLLTPITHTEILVASCIFRKA